MRKAGSRRHSITINLRAADDPPKTNTNHEHNDDHSPHAEAQESPPGKRDGLGLSVYAGLRRAACR